MDAAARPRLPIRRCAVAGCPGAGNNRTFHRFPLKSKSVCAEWIKRCDAPKFFSVKSARICSNHFELSSFTANKRLKKGVLPVLNLSKSYQPAVPVPAAAAETAVPDPPAVPVPAAAAETSVPDQQAVPVPAAAAETVVRDQPAVPVPAAASPDALLKKRYKHALKKIASLQQTIKLLSTKKERKKIVKKHLKDLGYDSNYISHILNPSRSRRKQYSKEEVSTALVLRSMSSKSYEYIRKNKLFPLPSRQTLERWLCSLVCKPGLNSNFISLLGKKLENHNQYERQAALLFDEVSLMKVYQYDARNKQVYKNHDKMQVVMVRSLFSHWKQVIFFDFDCNMSKDLISTIILKCENVGVHIRAIVFDMGNHTFIRQLRIRTELNYKMVNPADPSRLIYFFPDCPHNLKNLRNHNLDKGCLFLGGDDEFHALTKQHFRHILENDGFEVKICPKLSFKHIDCTGIERQRVRIAAQLFSATTAKALTFHFGEKIKVQSEAVSTINSYFDVMNSRIRFDPVPQKCAMSISNWDSHNQAIESMKVLVESMRFCNNPQKQSKLPFQQGILVSIKSIRALFQELTDEGVSYLYTARLNQDSLENHFSRLRYIGGDKSHPGPADAVNRLKILMVGKEPVHFVRQPSVEVPETDFEPEPESDIPEIFISKEVSEDLDLNSQPEDDDDGDDDWGDDDESLLVGLEGGSEENNNFQVTYNKDKDC